MAIGWARPAGACKCGIDAPGISAPIVAPAQAASVTMTEGHAVLTCDRIVGRAPIACTWRARYVLSRRGEAAAVGLAVEFPVGAVVRVELDGVVVASARSPDPRSLRERRSVAPPRTLEATWKAPQDGRVEVMVHADLRVDPWQSCCGPDTNNRRHPVLNPWNSSLYRFNYVSPEPPDDTAAWRFDVDTPRTWWSGFHEGEVRGRRRVRSVSGRQLSRNEPYTSLLIDRTLRLDRGGPIAAAGVSFEPGGVAPRLRFGWELAWPHYLVHTLAVETDTRRRVVLVPAWEGALSFLGTWFLDLGLGVGAPVQLAPAPRPGVRVLGRIGWRVVHLLGVYDAYPRFRGAPIEHHGALMLQLGM